MATLEELKRENARLRAIAEAKEDINSIDKERSKLISENRRLRHAKKIRVAKQIGTGLAIMGRGLGRGLIAVGNQYAKAHTSKVKRVRKVKRKY